MNKVKWGVIFFGSFFLFCTGREPFKPTKGSLPFLVYFTSRYRGKCVGTLVSRTVVITAAVCVTNPNSAKRDTRPINVVTGSAYRHARRGIRVQVTKILVPKLPPTDVPNRAYLMEKSVAILLLKRKVPDILAEVPLRAIDIDWKGETDLALQEECLIPGWHFFFRGDKIFPVHKYLLQRNVRAQFLNIVKMHMWCEALLLKFQKTLSSFGFQGYFDKDAQICVRDPDATAQPCHGMYGAPLICHGRAVGILLAPDAQWTNCTGFSNIVHLFSGSYIRKFMTCVSKLFVTDTEVDWKGLKQSLYDEDKNQFDYMPAMYDRVVKQASYEEDF